MSPDDRDVAGLLRAAVTSAGARAADTQMPDRLLTAMHQRRRNRRIATVMCGVAVAAAATAGASAWTAQRPDALITADSPDANTARVSPSRAGAVTPEQAARAGLDAGPQCDSDAVRNVTGVPRAEGEPARLTAGYLTSLQGYETWTSEYQGTMGIRPGGQPDGDGLVALCWFEGNIPRDGSVSGGPTNPRFRLIAVHLTAAGGQMKQDTISANPLPIVAPPPPDPADLPPDVAGQERVVHPQYAGVPIVDVLVEPPPPPPVDCLTDGCPDDEVEVKPVVRLNGEPYNPSAGADVAAGTVLNVEVTLRVESGEQVDDLQVGLMADTTVGGKDPLPFVLHEATGPVSGERTLQLTWQVPTGPADRSLIIRYTIFPAAAEQRTFVDIGWGTLRAR